MNDNIALFLFDFDGTLVDGHSHNYIGSQLWTRLWGRISNHVFKSYAERDQAIFGLTKEISIELMKSFLADDNLNWKNTEKIKDLMKGILASGHKIGIVSFNNYSNAVKYAIEQLLGKEDAEKVYIKSALPATDYKEIQLCDKASYILEVMSNTDITNKANVFFMDDDQKHITAAHRLGVQAVLVKKEGTEHIDSAYNFLWKFNAEQEIYVDQAESKISACEAKILAYEKNGIIFDPIYEDLAKDGSHILGNHDYYKIN